VYRGYSLREEVDESIHCIGVRVYTEFDVVCAEYILRTAWYSFCLASKTKPFQGEGALSLLKWIGLSGEAIYQRVSSSVNQ
jgi:hypothetical protein